MQIFTCRADLRVCAWRRRGEAAKLSTRSVQFLFVYSICWACACYQNNLPPQRKPTDRTQRPRGCQSCAAFPCTPSGCGSSQLRRSLGANTNSGCLQAPRGAAPLARSLSQLVTRATQQVGKLQLQMGESARESLLAGSAAAATAPACSLLPLAFHLTSPRLALQALTCHQITANR